MVCERVAICDKVLLCVVVGLGLAELEGVVLCVCVSDDVPVEDSVPDDEPVHDSLPESVCEAVVDCDPVPDALCDCEAVCEEDWLGVGESERVTSWLGVRVDVAEEVKLCDGVAD